MKKQNGDSYFGTVWASTAAIIATGALCAFLLLSGGCGGGSSSNGAKSPTASTTGVAGTGRAVFRITWPPARPATSRLIPQASLSVQIQVKDGDKVLATRLIPRPTGAAAAAPSVVEIKDLPAKNLIDVVRAYPNADGSGVAQAEATAPVKIPIDDTATVPLTMESTIDHLDIFPSSASLLIDATQTFVATPRNAAGEEVLIAPNTLKWASSAPTIVDVDDKGEVTANEKGVAAVTVTEPESGKSASVPVSVADDVCRDTPSSGSESGIDGDHFDLLDLPQKVTVGQTVTFTVVLHDVRGIPRPKVQVGGSHLVISRVFPVEGAATYPNPNGPDASEAPLDRYTSYKPNGSRADTVYSISYTQAAGDEECEAKVMVYEPYNVSGYAYSIAYLIAKPQ